nr:collagen alpha-2(I) chain [Oryctolagus cuniculus]
MVIIISSSRSSAQKQGATEEGSEGPRGVPRCGIPPTRRLAGDEGEAAQGAYLCGGALRTRGPAGARRCCSGASWGRPGRAGHPSCGASRALPAAGGRGWLPWAGLPPLLHPAEDRAGPTATTATGTEARTAAAADEEEEEAVEEEVSARAARVSSSRLGERGGGEGRAAAGISLPRPPGAERGPRCPPSPPRRVTAPAPRPGPASPRRAAAAAVRVHRGLWRPWLPPGCSIFGPPLGVLPESAGADRVRGPPSHPALAQGPSPATSRAAGPARDQGPRGGMRGRTRCPRRPIYSWWHCPKLARPGRPSAGGTASLLSALPQEPRLSCTLAFCLRQRHGGNCPPGCPRVTSLLSRGRNCARSCEALAHARQENQSLRLLPGKLKGCTVWRFTVGMREMCAADVTGHKERPSYSRCGSGGFWNCYAQQR